MMACLAAMPSTAGAGSLADRLGRFIQEETRTEAGRSVADFVTPAVKRVALRGIDLPLTSTTPGFAYRFDPQLLIFERVSTSLGPVFVERPETVGKGHLDVGASILWADLSEIDGGEFGLATADVSVNPLGPGPPLAFSALSLDDFDLETVIANLTATYGITNRWDVNLLVPVIHTDLRVDATSFRSVGAPEKRRLTESATGFGDVVLRTKLRLVDRLASGLSLRLPSGEDDDFHGLGDTTLTPFLAFSQPFRGHDVHLVAGMTANADDLERSRAQYAGGISLRVLEELSLLVDVIGSSALAEDEFTLSSSSPVILPPEAGVEIRQVTTDAGRQRVVAAVPRDDTVDLSFGVKVAVAQRCVLFGGAILPLTSAGLRASAVLTTSIEVVW